MSGLVGEVWRVVTSSQEWLHAYTAQDERLLSWQVGGAEKIRWTLRGLDQQVLREFVYDRPTATGVVERDNVHRGVGGPLLMSQGPLQTTHFHVDHLGTPRLLTDHTGAQVAFHAYYPYGEEATDPEQNEIRYKFTGHERDLAEPTSTADDLDHMHARMHNPLIGRFLSVDRVGGNPRRPQTWNRYAYVSGNPLRRIDPNGLVEFDVIVRTFIPAASVTDPFGNTFKGDGREFSADPSASYRTRQILRIETDSAKTANPLRSQRRTTGPTERLSPNPARAQASVEGLTASGSRDAQGNALISVQGSVANPLVPLAPPIAYTLSATASPSGDQFTITGSQGGYPGMEIFIRNEQGQVTPVYQFDPASVGNGLEALLPWIGDQSIAVTCTGFTSDKGNCAPTTVPE